MEIASAGSPCMGLFRIVLLVTALPSLSFAARPEGSNAPIVPSNLTLDDAIRIFRTHGFDLLIAEASVASAEGDVASARQIYNPNLGYSFAHIFNYDPVAICGKDASQCSPNVHSFTLSDNAAIEDVVAGKRRLRIAVAEAAFRSARMARVDAQRNLEFQLKSQYVQVALAQSALDFAVDVEKGWNESFGLANLRYEKGAISERDEAQIEAASLEAAQAVSENRQTLLVGKAALAFLLGVREKGGDFEVDRDLLKFSIPARLTTANPESLLHDAFELRPDLKAIKAQTERAQAAVAAAKRSRFPDLALGLGFNYAASGGPLTSSNTTPPTVIVGVSGNLPFFYQQQGEIKKAEADLRTQMVTLAKTRAQVLSDVQAAHASYAASRERVERMERRLLDRIRVQRDLTKLMYEKGASSLLEYLDAQRAFIATNLEYLTDLASYWTAVFQLEQAVGMEIRR